MPVRALPALARSRPRGGQRGGAFIAPLQSVTSFRLPAS